MAAAVETEDEDIMGERTSGPDLEEAKLKRTQGRDRT